MQHPFAGQNIQPPGPPSPKPCLRILILDNSTETGVRQKYLNPSKMSCADDDDEDEKDIYVADKLVSFRVRGLSH